MARHMMTDDLKKEWLGLIMEGLPKSAASAAIGFTWTTIRRALEADQDFLDAYMTIEGQRTDQVEEALFKTAIKGNVEAQKFWLTNKAREEWRNSQHVEHTGVNGGPIMVAAAATLALREVLSDPETRERAIDYIEAELVPGDPTPELGPARVAEPLEEDRFSSELGLLSQPGDLDASEASDGDESDGYGGFDFA